MATSTSDVYVWTWLPRATEPIVAGRLRRVGGRLEFGYARSYRDNPNAISLYGPELPLAAGWIEPAHGLTLAGAIRDGCPDSWGRRVIETRLQADEGTHLEEVYMLASGTNRLGAIDFQERPDVYAPRIDESPLAELHEAAERLQEGIQLSDSVVEALIHGTSIGGARPKVLVRDEVAGEWIAKLSATSDRFFSVTNAEGTAMSLARRVGIEVPETRVITSLGREVLLVRRFDREPDGQRHHVVSGLTMALEDENAARYVTYPTLNDVLRAHGDTTAGPALFERIAFNIAISNSDDHARNHAAFWDGRTLKLTPAYDLAPGPRSGETATQAMAYGSDGEKASNFASLFRHAGMYGLNSNEAREVIDRIIDTIESHFAEAADENRVSSADRDYLWRRQFLNPGVLHGYRPLR
ncbi:MAG: type II toxin-antitoxin system HipA family toxin [Aeromicrobium sp.]|nr:MAG: type II toxin-antitoxin system HipA family toxin [Aeromicrobium sp.]